ncbi:helix-turn-helix domain-containing protein [Streptomyces sp. NPDC021093]|uniref:helix-turn-helix domain-containing protein n=1 Tax=Streptomyces sp. NPDC021093 TaxID=3365112 RepID=UPI00379E7DA1
MSRAPLYPIQSGPRWAGCSFRSSGRSPSSSTPSCPRTRDGLAAARARGRTGGQKPKLGPRQVQLVRKMYDETLPDGTSKYTAQEIAEEFGVTRPTIYRHLDKIPHQPDPATQHPAAPVEHRNTHTHQGAACQAAQARYPSGVSPAPSTRAVRPGRRAWPFPDGVNDPFSHSPGLSTSPDRAPTAAHVTHDPTEGDKGESHGMPLSSTRDGVPQADPPLGRHPGR